MGDVKLHEPVLPIAAVFSRHVEAIAWAKDRAVREWGPLAVESEPFQFTETKFYDATMGSGLTKVLWAFERLIEPSRLVDLKLLTNAWEDEYRLADSHAEARPLNIDPGYLTEAKVVLATTKDRDHRLYLDRGIYAEVTLVYQGHAWQSRPWTYPDYRRPDYHRCFDQCRDYLRRRYGR